MICGTKTAFVIFYIHAPATDSNLASVEIQKQKSGICKCYAAIFIL